MAVRPSPGNLSKVLLIGTTLLFKQGFVDIEYLVRSLHFTRNHSSPLRYLGIGRRGREGKAREQFYLLRKIFCISCMLLIFQAFDLKYKFACALQLILGQSLHCICAKFIKAMLTGYNLARNPLLYYNSSSKH